MNKLKDSIVVCVITVRLTAIKQKALITVCGIILPQIVQVHAAFVDKDEQIRLIKFVHCPLDPVRRIAVKQPGIVIIKISNRWLLCWVYETHDGISDHAFSLCCIGLTSCYDYTIFPEICKSQDYTIFIKKDG